MDSGDVLVDLTDRGGSGRKTSAMTAVPTVMDGICCHAPGSQPRRPEQGQLRPLRKSCTRGRRSSTAEWCHRECTHLVSHGASRSCGRISTARAKPGGLLFPFPPLVPAPAPSTKTTTNSPCFTCAVYNGNGTRATGHLGCRTSRRSRLSRCTVRRSTKLAIERLSQRLVVFIIRS